VGLEGGVIVGPGVSIGDDSFIGTGAVAIHDLVLIGRTDPHVGDPSRPMLRDGWTSAQICGRRGQADPRTTRTGPSTACRSGVCPRAA